jgi:hypothetical protein
MHAQLWEREGRGWARAAGGRLKCGTPAAAEQYMELLLQGQHSQLSDFDDHLNDVAKCASAPCPAASGVVRCCWEAGGSSKRLVHPCEG